jgi:nicotinate-nucleotide adenylyltransferase
MRLGVFGGTFDPVHQGHLILAEQAREQLHLDRVRFVPAGEPWRKAALEVSPAWQRLQMVRLAVEANAAFEVDDCEVVREGPSYTVDTLRLIKRGLSVTDELFLILGGDALADLPNWHDPAAIAAEAIIAVVPREGTVLSELPFSPDRLLRIEMPYIGISSTDLRERVHNGQTIRYLVPAAVEAYIREQRLYQS